MAKAEWLIVSPESGTGSGQISFSSAPYMGREQRTTQATVEASGAEPQVVSVTQEAHDEFVSVDEVTKSISNEGGEVVITGTSNSTILTFALGTGTIEITIPETYKVNTDVDTNNGEAVPGDPGASDQYTFSLTLTVPANATVEEVTREVTVTDNASNSQTVTITQTASAATLSLSTNEVTLNANGDAVQVDVFSNTSWTVS